MFGDIGNTFEMYDNTDYTLIVTIVKVNLSDFLVTEENVKDTVCISRPKSYRLFMKCLSHPEFAMEKGYSATDIHLSDYVTSVVGHRWQDFRERTRTRLISFTRDRHFQ